MNLTAAWCAECKVYLGLQDAEGAVPASFPMPHIPGCRMGERERALLRDDPQPWRETWPPIARRAYDDE